MQPAYRPVGLSPVSAGFFMRCYNAAMLGNILMILIAILTVLVFWLSPLLPWIMRRRRH